MGSDDDGQESRGGNAEHPSRNASQSEQKEKDEDTSIMRSRKRRRTFSSNKRKRKNVNGEDGKDSRISKTNGGDDDDNANGNEEDEEEKSGDEENDEEVDDGEEEEEEEEENPDIPGPTVSGGIIDFPLHPMHRKLICPLCMGYFRDPHTIAECLHTFCRSCLFFAFRQGIRRCPECDVPLGPDPFRAALSDRTMQELVDKIFPELAEQDERDERDFYRRRGIQLKKEYAEENNAAPPAPPAPAADSDSLDTNKKSATSADDTGENQNTINKKEDEDATDNNNNNNTEPNHNEHQNKDGKDSEPNGTSGTKTTNSNGTSPKEAIPHDELDFVMTPDSTTDEGHRMPPLRKNILRTSGRLKIFSLKKYLLQNLGITALPSTVEIVCNGDPLGDELSLTFVRRTRWLHPSNHLTLSYRFGEEGTY